MASVSSDFLASTSNQKTFIGQVSIFFSSARTTHTHIMILSHILVILVHESLLRLQPDITKSDAMNMILPDSLLQSIYLKCKELRISLFTFLKVPQVRTKNTFQITRKKQHHLKVQLKFISMVKHWD